MLVMISAILDITSVYCFEEQLMERHIIFDVGVLICPRMLISFNI